MTDRFDEAASRVAYDPAWPLDEDTAVYLKQDIITLLRDTHNAALEEATRQAAMFSVKEGASLVPGVRWGEMTDNARFVGHATAQGIAADIRALKVLQS